MILGCVADDFTGAGDLANTLARGGMATTQFVGVPSQPARAVCEAGVVSLKTRSAPIKQATAESLAAFAWLKAQGCRQFLFKYCSTFDSTREGNIGPVAEALLDATRAPIAVVCPAFPLNGRRVFLGHLFVGDRLLSESGMEKHPLTPMTDPDIRRWLRYQTRGEVGHVPYSTVRAGSARIAEALERESVAGRRLAVVDAIDDDDLLAIGGALQQAVLITGSSGIALGLPANFRTAGLLGAGTSGWAPVSGPGVVVSGSCSGQSVLQVAKYLNTHPGMRIDPTEVLNCTQTPLKAAATLMAMLEREPIVYSTARPEELLAAQAAHGQAITAVAIEKFFAELAVLLAEAGVSRFVVGGGETSGAVVSALGVSELSIGPEIDPGVPAMASQRRDRPLGLVLKSGNFGAADFYERAMAIAGGIAPQG